MMYRRCVTEEAALRQKQVEECLLKNMTERPYDEISITQLCQQLGISRKAFYRYYTSKDACLCALLDRTLMEWRFFKCADSVIPSDVPQEISSFLAFWRQKKSLLNMLIQNNLIDKLVSRTILYVINEERYEAEKKGAFDFIHDDDVRLFFISGIIALIIQWHITGYKQSDEEMAHKMSRLLLNPLTNLAGQKSI